MEKVPCSGCGWRVVMGSEGCRARFDEFIARDFSDAVYFRTHRLLVDTYALQHPDDFCGSAKSLAAHLSGLCAILENGASMAVGQPGLQGWLDGGRALAKPAVPRERGSLTIGDLPEKSDPEAWKDALRRWSESTWDAYAELHPLARKWLRQSEQA